MAERLPVSFLCCLVGGLGVLSAGFRMILASLIHLGNHLFATACMEALDPRKVSIHTFKHLQPFLSHIVINIHRDSMRNEPDNSN